MPGRCGCAGTTCGCLLTGAGGVLLSGTGTTQDPYVVTLDALEITGLLEVDDTTNVDLTILGSGEAGDPYVLSATINPGVTVTTTPTTGGTTLVDDDTRVHFLNHAATIATHTLTLPATSNALEKEVKIIADHIITALTVGGAGGTTVAGMPTTLAANGYFRAQLIGTVWRRVG